MCYVVKSGSPLFRCGVHCFRLVVYVLALLSLTFMSVVEIVVILLLLWSPCKLDFISKFLLHVSGVFLSILISVSGLHPSLSFMFLINGVLFYLLLCSPFMLEYGCYRFPFFMTEFFGCTFFCQKFYLSFICWTCFITSLSILEFCFSHLFL